MISVLTRFSRLRAALGRQGNPYLRGRACQLAGTALLADGLVGLDNPLGGRGKRAGILGSILAVVIVAVMLFALSLATRSSGPFPDGATATGTVTAVQRETPTGSTSSSTCSATVTYTVAGARHQVGTGQSSSSLCSAQGQRIDVSYLPSDPGAGRPQVSGTSTLLRVATAACWVALVLTVVGVAVRAGEIVAGAWLLLRGRSLVRSVPPVPTGEVLDELREAWSGPRASAAAQR